MPAPRPMRCVLRPEARYTQEAVVKKTGGRASSGHCGFFCLLNLFWISDLGFRISATTARWCYQDARDPVASALRPVLCLRLLHLHGHDSEDLRFAALEQTAQRVERLPVYEAHSRGKHH